MRNGNEPRSKYSVFMQWLGESSWSLFLIIISCFISGWTWLMWILPHWDYLPDWVPAPGPQLMWPIKCLQPIILCILGLPVISLSIVSLVANLTLLSRRIRQRRGSGVIQSLVALMVLGLAPVPWIFGKTADDLMVRYAISRYDVAIDAIEQYHEDNGEYPPNLEALVPDYLPEPPGIYMKFGETLKYDPNSELGYVGCGPFTFELYGAYMGIHGQTLKYCPVEDESCAGFNRIDARWVWAYSSAL